MDFKSLIDFFRQDDWTEDLVTRFDQMLALGGAMFAYTMDVLVECHEDTDPQGQIFDRDRRINVLVREVRRRVISRLSAGGRGGEVPTALIFMNAVKDAERIGDYVKNLHEILELKPADSDCDLYRQWLGGATAEITKLVEATRKAFGESSPERAGAVIERSRRLGRECEDRIRELSETDLGLKDGIAIVLAFRFIKRISSHLSNIATTVVMPVDLLDFHDEPRG